MIRSPIEYNLLCRIKWKHRPGPSSKKVGLSSKMRWLIWGGFAAKTGVCHKRGDITPDVHRLLSFRLFCRLMEIRPSASFGLRTWHRFPAIRLSRTCLIHGMSRCKDQFVRDCWRETRVFPSAEICEKLECHVAVEAKVGPMPPNFWLLTIISNAALFFWKNIIRTNGHQTCCRT